jgi:hypothetical protein
MAKGLQIGVQIGEARAEQQMRQQQQAQKEAEFQQQMNAEDAAQKFKEMQAARQTQQVAQEQALAEAAFQAKAAEAAGRAKSMLSYQKDIASGVDPTQALLKHAPGMTGGASMVGSALRSQEMAKAAQDRLAFQNKALAAKVPNVARLPVGSTYDPGDEATPPSWRTPIKASTQSLSAQDRDSLRASRKILSDYAKQGADPIMAKAYEKMAKADPKAYKEQMDQIRNAADSILELEPDDAQAKRYANRKGGNSSGEKVRVISPDGVPGMLPKENLDEALKAGYKKAE